MGGGVPQETSYKFISIILASLRLAARPPRAVLDGGGSTSGFGDDGELLVRASAVLKSPVMDAKLVYEVYVVYERFRITIISVN